VGLSDSVTSVGEYCEDDPVNYQHRNHSMPIEREQTSFYLSFISVEGQKLECFIRTAIFYHYSKKLVNRLCNSLVGLLSHPGTFYVYCSICMVTTLEK
jgi:hypothetical protein